MASDTKSSVVKVRPGNQDASSKGKVGASGIKKKIEISSTRQIPDSKHSITKFEVKSRTVSSSSSKTTTKTTVTQVKGKKEKKVYTLAGQKFDPPEEREPLRIFYESLSKQIPTSEMAEFWWALMCILWDSLPMLLKKAGFYRQKDMTTKRLYIVWEMAWFVLVLLLFNHQFKTGRPEGGSQCHHTRVRNYILENRPI